MGWAITADVDRYDEAVDALQERSAITADQLAALTVAERQRAFWIATVNELRVVQTVLDEVERAVAEGLPLQDFRKRVRESVSVHEVGGAHLDTVFVNAVQTSYNAGRYEQITRSSLRGLRPYWAYDSVLDARTTKVCKAMDGCIKAHDDPFWLTHYPPLHHRCRGAIRTLRRSEAERRGITVGSPGDPQEGFGLTPPQRTSEPEPDAAKVDPDALAIYRDRRATDPDNTQTPENDNAGD